jgi:phenylacetate-CoA ligase
MFIVRGENIYPAAIEDVLRGVPGFGGEFRVIVSRREAMDELLVRAEHAAAVDDDSARGRLAQTMKDRLRARLGVTPVVELVPEGALPRTEFKARRVIDDRDLYRQHLKEKRDV